MGNGGSVVYMYPSKIRFTHDSIASYFSDGHSIPETFRQILWKKITADNLPLIEVMNYEGQWFAVRGNRKLFVFKELEKRGELSKVKVQKIVFDQYLFRTQYTSSNKGKTTLIRDFRHYAMKQELDLIWSEYQCDKNESTIDTMYLVAVYVLALVVWVGLLHKFKPPY